MSSYLSQFLSYPAFEIRVMDEKAKRKLSVIEKKRLPDSRHLIPNILTIPKVS